MSEILELSLALRELPVVLVDKGGNKKKYVLRELNGERRDKYLNSAAKKMSFDAGGDMTGVTDYQGLQSSLVAMCLFDESGEPVTEQEIQSSFPCTTITALFSKAQELSGLSGRAVEQAKND